MNRCRREIAQIESLICAGHPEIEGLCLALTDWNAELRLIESEGNGHAGGGQFATEWLKNLHFRELFS